MSFCAAAALNSLNSWVVVNIVLFLPQPGPHHHANNYRNGEEKGKHYNGEHYLKDCHFRALDA
jgi:hypothetical protein